MKDFLNRESMYECIKGIYEDALDADEVNKYESIIEDCAWNAATHAVNNMREYVHQRDTHIMGNFNNIRTDWDYIKSSYWVADSADDEAVEIKPFGRFDDMVKGMDEDTLTDEQVEIVQIWCEGWFFETFGTYNLKYNFQSMIDEFEYEEECA